MLATNLCWESRKLVDDDYYLRKNSPTLSPRYIITRALLRRVIIKQTTCAIYVRMRTAPRTDALTGGYTGL